MKLTGNKMRLYLSMSDGDIPPSLARFFLQWSKAVGGWWRRSSCWPGTRAWGAAWSRRLLDPPWTPRTRLLGPRLRKGSCIVNRISCNAKANWNEDQSMQASLEIIFLCCLLCGKRWFTVILKSILATSIFYWILLDHWKLLKQDAAFWDEIILNFSF